MRNQIGGISAAIAVLLLAGCANVTYRCPLDSSEEADSPTACSSMQDSVKGARLGGGGRNSTLVGDDGRLVKLDKDSGYGGSNTTARASSPIAAPAYRGGPVVAPSIAPNYEPPVVFQVWTDAYQDAEGNLHDGRNSYFATPGRWTYGDKVETTAPVTVPGGAQASVGGSRMLSPSRTDELPQGRIVKPVKGGVSPGVPGTVDSAAAQAPRIDVRPNTPLQSPNGDLSPLSGAARAVKAMPAGVGVTPPGVTLN